MMLGYHSRPTYCQPVDNSIGKLLRF